MKTIKNSILAIELVIVVILFGGLMCALTTYVGYHQFKNQMADMYGTTTKELASTAASYIDADKLSSWLLQGRDQQWQETYERLDVLTRTAELAYIYVTVIENNYKSRIYVFDTVNPLVEGGKAIPFAYSSSLENKDETYINNIKKVIEKGESYTSIVYNRSGGHVTIGYPLVKSDGSIDAMLGIVKPMTEISSYKKRFLRSMLIAALVLTVIFIAFYTLTLYMGLIKPILFITYETTHFAEHHGELSGILKKIKNRDEIGTLAKSVEKMSEDMNRYITDLTHATAEKERLGAELKVATHIQAEMLPRVFPPYKNHPELELFASMTPAKEVGGDFYDFYMIDDDHFAVVVGDVSGKGVPAALFMVITKTLLKDAAMHCLSPAEIFTSINSVLCEGNESGLFVTCWMGILTISSGDFEFANAGHNPPLLYADGDFSYLKTKPDLMLAGMEGIKYTKHSINLKKGDRLFIYTDGVTEASNRENQLYGEDRLLNVIKKTTELSSRQVLELVRKDIDGFVNGAQQFDDITMLEMTYKD